MRDRSRRSLSTVPSALWGVLYSNVNEVTTKPGNHVYVQMSAVHRLGVGEPLGGFTIHYRGRFTRQKVVTMRTGVSVAPTCSMHSPRHAREAGSPTAASSYESR